MNVDLTTNTSLDVYSFTGTPSSDPLAIELQRSKPLPLLEKLVRGLTCPIRLLPDFLLIGTQKGGTTSLYTYLQAHPAIRPAARKEVHFFDRRCHLNKGLAWYRGHFPTRVEKYYAHHLREQAFLTGEATPDYLFLPYVPTRVARMLPQVKLIVLLRNPVDRAYSQYYHAIELGHETLSFEEALDLEEERTRQERERTLKDEHYHSYAYKHLSYLSRGMYVEQLQVWMNLFPREQFLILKSEEFYADPATTLKEVLTFLNVPVVESHLRKKEYKQYNNNSYTKMAAPMRSRLVDYFQPHNARLYELLGLDFGWDQ